MKIERYKCDWCNKELEPKNILSVNIKTDREPDPSGNGYIQNHKTLDICHSCIEKLLNNLYEQGMLTNEFV